MKGLISFIVFSSVSCLVAAASALWEYARRSIRGMFVARPMMKKRYGDI